MSTLRSVLAFIFLANLSVPPCMGVNNCGVNIRLTDAGERLLLTVMDSLFRVSTTDTISARQLTFSFNTPRQVSVTTIRATADDMPRQVTFVVVPGQEINLDGTFDSPVLSGSEFCEQQNLAWQEVHKPSRQEYVALFKKHQARRQRGADVDFRQWQLSHQLRALDFIRRHPGWDASAVLLCELRDSLLERGLAMLAPDVRQGALRVLVAEKQRVVSRRHRQLQAAADTQVGQPAPDFTLNDRQEVPHRLSDFRGRYVIIDFWASWCVPCRAGMPQLKAFAAAHAERLAVLGVATWDVPEGWRRALDTLQLPWVNVYCHKNQTPDAAAMYAVKALPTKFLVSPDGKILLRDEGDDTQFYQQIEQIIK